MSDSEIKQASPGNRLSRRQALGSLSLFGLIGPALLVSCGGEDSSNPAEISAATEVDSDATVGGSCVLIPQETEGPYPLTAVLSNSAMVRQDITEGKSGIPLTLKLSLVDVNNGCAAVTNASVYVWHCDKEGVYSGYSQPGANTIGETFCRGIQDTDANGEVTFATIYPGWYAGRITHIHFQVFLFSSTLATATSQLAFPQAITIDVYNTDLYGKGQNTSVMSFSNDNVFSDGITYQMASVSGNVEDGYSATLQVGIAV